MLPIAQNQALFSLLGTTYGGNGQTTFALPDLRGRSPVHIGQGARQYLTGRARRRRKPHADQHRRCPRTRIRSTGDAADASVSTPTGNVWAASTNNPFSSSAPDTALNPASVSAAGGSQPHANLQPYLVVNFVIALQGIFPSRN